MISPQFQDLYKKLNPQQREAVDAIEGPVMVIAGPGTGKTQILTLRIANILLKTQVNPENILALTFSEAASFEMRLRLSEIIGTPAFRVETSTFHSFANDIIKNYPDEFPLLLSSENITEVEQIELIEKLIDKLDLKILRPYGDPLYYLKDILAAIGDLKKEGVGVEKLAVAIQKQIEDFENIDDLIYEKGVYKGQMKGKYQDIKKNIEKSEEFLKVYEGYEKEMKEQKKYDFNDMLLEVVRALESNQPLLLRIQEKYQYILVDEHQDTNAAQNRLIELVAKFYKIPNLFVVGDEKQAIYRFQGASLENFLYFKNLYKSAKLINLQKNYRSHQIILDGAGSLIEKNISSNILPQMKLLSEGKKETEKIKLAALSDYHLEYEYIASDIEEKIKGGVDPSEIVVLGRRNMDLNPLAAAFSRRGIKFIIQSDQDVFSDLQIQKLIMILESVGKSFDEVCFVRALHVDFLEIEPFDVYKILGYARAQRTDIFKIISKLSDSIIKELQLENPEALSSFYKKYIDWVKEKENIPFDDLFVKIINESGMRKYFLSTPERYLTLSKLTAVFDEIKLQLYKNPAFSLDDFLRLLETIKKHKVNLRAKQENSLEEGVRLFTVHKSKGLEFDWVYMINCFEGRWGGRKKWGGKIKLPWEYLGADIKTKVTFEEIEDERRLFYVGLTRARKGIILSYAKKGIDGREQLPSPFIQEIDPEFITEAAVSSFEKDFDGETLFEVSKEPVADPKNKKYLQKLFSEKGLSVTGLDNFLECPWKYFFRNLVVLPDIKSKVLIFGTAVHFAIDRFIKLRNTGVVNEQFLLDRFHESLAGEALPERDFNELKEKGDKALRLFYKEIIPNWPEDIQSEMTIRGIRFDDGIILNGKIDMIEPLSNDGSVRVHDFKTGRVKPRTQIDGSKNADRNNYLRQLVFYKILLDRHKEGLFKTKTGVIDFVEPDEKGRFHSEVFEISGSDVKNLEETIKSVAKQIINLDFWDRRCDDKDCDYCKLRNLTFGSEI